MTDNELLLAIGNIMDKKLDARFKPLDAKVDALDAKVGALDARVGALETDVKLLKLQNENVIIPRLQNIEDCYLSTFNRYKDSVEGYEAMQADIELLKEVAREHSEKLQKIS